MMLGATSICVVTDHTTTLNHATHSSSLSDYKTTFVFEKFPLYTCGHKFRRTLSKNNTNHLLRRGLRNLAPINSSPNGNYEADMNVSYGFYNELVNGALEKNKEVKDSDSEVNSVLSQSRLGLSQEVVNLKNQKDVLDKLRAVQLHLIAMEQWNASRLKLCDRKYKVSAANLIHYLALRSLDIEQLSEDLSYFWLLNLETINSNVLPSLSAAIHMLDKSNITSLNIKATSVVEEMAVRASKGEPKKSKNSMKNKRSFNNESLLGPLRDDKTTHIMVTIGAEALQNDEYITDIIKAGATIIRINCAHGDPSLWSEIIRKVKTSSKMLEKQCRILMDLAGPKLRTGKLNAGPCVIKVSPKKNANGEVIFPSKIWLCPKNSGPFPASVSPDAVIHIDGQEFLTKLELNDVIEFLDSRGKQRVLKISEKIPVFSGVGFIAECFKTAYIKSGTEFYVKGKRTKKSNIGLVVDVPQVEQFVRLRVGDLLTISRDSLKGKLSIPTKSDHTITCPCGYLFDSVKPGEPIAFDDGKIWGVIKGTSSSEIVVSITYAGLKGTKLGSEKSINIPKSNIRFEGLTSKDILDLDFVSSHADMVGISFIRGVNDIVLLCQELEKRKNRNLGVILKIETKEGFENLPLILLEAMKCENPLGVMIARGDLAVECGWEKLADIQEEIIYICNAAHVPVVWATQVLESLVKTGVPTRAEITDVANGKRASCIMLNKGKHVIEAISTLDTILHPKSKVKPGLKALMLSSKLS